MLVMRAGDGWALPAADKKDAEASAKAVREFLGLGERMNGEARHTFRCAQSPLIRPASISSRLKRRASAPPAQA